MSVERVCLMLIVLILSVKIINHFTKRGASTTGSLEVVGVSFLGEGEVN